MMKYQQRDSRKQYTGQCFMYFLVMDHLDCCYIPSDGGLQMFLYIGVLQNIFSARFYVQVTLSIKLLYLPRKQLHPFEYKVSRGIQERKNLIPLCLLSIL